MENVIIASGVRTPIGAYGGSLKDLHVTKYTSLVLNAALARIGLDPGQVDDVIMGQSYQNGECANGARMSLLEAGWPEEVPGVTLDRRCCSGLDAVFFGVMMTVNLMIGTITPPVGLSLFVAQEIAGISLEQICRSIVPFLLVEVGALLLITYVPDLVLFLPNLLWQK